MLTGPLFRTMNDAWASILASLIHRGRYQPSRNGAMRESIGVSFTLTDPRYTLLDCPPRKLSAAYAAAELLLAIVMYTLSYRMHLNTKPLLKEASHTAHTVIDGQVILHTAWHVSSSCNSCLIAFFILKLKQLYLC